MKVSVDNVPVEGVLDNGRPATVRELVDRLKEMDKFHGGETLYSVDIDGRRRTMVSVGEDETPISDASEIEIETGDAVKFAAAVLQQACDMCRLIVDACAEVAAKLKDGDVETANIHLLFLLDSIQRTVHCYRSVTGVEALGIELPEEANNVSEKLESSLTSIETMQKKSDWNGLAEALESECAETFESFHRIFEICLGQVAGR